MCRLDDASAYGDDCDDDGAFDARFLAFLSRAQPYGLPPATFRSLPKSSLTFTACSASLVLKDGLERLLLGIRTLSLLVLGEVGKSFR